LVYLLILLIFFGNDGTTRTKCIYYAHAGAGELHLRPVLNLKTTEGVHQFRNIATEVAILVKNRGSLSGEHGDGIVRGEFCRL
jgi:FAD/FMN-containing dehydrogenase